MENSGFAQLNLVMVHSEWLNAPASNGNKPVPGEVSKAARLVEIEVFFRKLKIQVQVLDLSEVACAKTRIAKLNLAIAELEPGPLLIWDERLNLSLSSAVKLLVTLNSEEAEAVLLDVTSSDRLHRERDPGLRNSLSELLVFQKSWLAAIQEKLKQPGLSTPFTPIVLLSEKGSRSSIGLDPAGKLFSALTLFRLANLRLQAVTVTSKESQFLGLQSDNLSKNFRGPGSPEVLPAQEFTALAWLRRQRLNFSLFKLMLSSTD